MGSTDIIESSIDLMEKLQDEMYKLYDRHGVQPTHFILGGEVVRAILNTLYYKHKAADCVMTSYTEEGERTLCIFGLKAIEARDPCTIKAAIIYEE